MRKLLFLLLGSCLLSSCTADQAVEASYSAQEIIDRAIEAAGGDLYERAKIDFEFRNRLYRSFRDGGRYELERFTQDSSGVVTRDVLSNDGFLRFQEGEKLEVSDSMATRYSNSVNSVHYFAQLPYGLNAPAVQKALLGEDRIGGEAYYEIGITFQQEGGGTDFQDQFVYWVHQEDFTVDYLAYNYETDGGGVRFREAYNPRVVEGIRFVDYRNFKPEPEEVSMDLTELDQWFTDERLKLLSTIETEAVQVRILGE